MPFWASSAGPISPNTSVRLAAAATVSFLAASGVPVDDPQDDRSAAAQRSHPACPKSPACLRSIECCVYYMPSCEDDTNLRCRDNMTRLPLHNILRLCQRVKYAR